jgi:hypothetical protein
VRRDGSRAPFKPRSFLLSLISTHTSFQALFNEAMMSLVATPIVAARVAAPKKVRTQTVAKASSADQAKSSAVAGALALTMLAQPALAMNELGQIADKQADAKALAAAQFAELQVKKKAPTAAPKTKNLAAGLPSFSLPSISAPSVGGGSKSAPAVKAAKAAPAEKIEVRRVPPLSLSRARTRSRARARRARSAPHRDDDVERDRVAVFPDTHDRSIVSENVVSFLVKNPHSDLSLPRALRTTAGPGQARLRDGHPVLPPDRGRGSVSADAPARGSPGGGGQGLLPQGHHALLSRARGKQSVSRSRGGALRRERVRRRRDLSSRDRRSDAREML